MIFVSSSCLRGPQRIVDVVQRLIDLGYSNIELSGGTEAYPALDSDLQRLQVEHGLSYICHNYFPPPEKHFVLNLASQCAELLEQSRTHLRNAVDLCKKLGAQRFGVHAGFFVDLSTAQLGRRLDQSRMFPRENCLRTFVEEFQALKEYAGELPLHIENNVFSRSNRQRFCTCPFMLTHFAEFEELRQELDFNILLDVAHLKVSCNSLGLSFDREYQKLIPQADYVHISDNDGWEDQNLGINRAGEIYHGLKEAELEGKTLTLEVYDSLQSLAESHTLLREVHHD